MPRLFRILALLLLSSAALADTAPPVYNRVNLSESAGTEVQNDQMVAVLFAQHQGRNATRLADQVNHEISEAIRIARDIPGIEVRTLGYRTQPVYDEGEIVGWRVSQSMRLQSLQGKVLGDLLGTLQKQLKLQSISYQVSPEQRRRYVDRVIQTALERFSKRAQLVAETLGKSHWRLVRLSINDGGSRPIPVMRAEMMMADMARAKAAPVAIEAGTARLNVTVSGEIELSD